MAVDGAEALTLKTLDDRIRVEIGGELFTEHIFEGMAKPILYPIIGPGATPMTRTFPMAKVTGEAYDHPHHRSLWFTHGDVNGVDFWSEGEGRGTIRQTEIVRANVLSDTAVIQTRNDWIDAEGKVVCTDTRTITIQVLPTGDRAIDYHIVIDASHGDITFGDTKEGTMGIRMHPNLRLDNDEKHGVTTANGHAMNNEGVTGRDLWGKHAKWVDYWGDIDGKTVGVAIFDHPTNPRHPTTWHARTYGLVAANPFGLHHFEGAEKGTGDMLVPSGESVTFAYRFVFHKGDAETAKIQRLYEDFTATTPASR